MESTREELAEIAEILERFRNIVGPIIPSALTTLDGWSWILTEVRERTLLTRGAGPIDLIAPIQRQTEVGWLNSLAIYFSDPESRLIFQADNWNFRTSPFILNTFNLATNQPNSALAYNNIYNPATPLGPIYGINWTPSQFWPYNTEVKIQAEHPATALTATSQVIGFALGRHVIRNRKQFYESIVREGERQALGIVQVPIRRDP